MVSGHPTQTRPWCGPQGPSLKLVHDADTVTPGSLHMGSVRASARLSACECARVCVHARVRMHAHVCA
jgi:hypothetical protein